MTKLRLAVVAVALLALGIGSSLAYAEALVADIQFPFKAAGNELPAGKYRIETNLQMEELVIRNAVTGKGLILPFTTRLSSRSENDALIVFDKAGDQYYLSEVYMPGIDGFQLQGAAGKHSHVKVKGGK